jgi:hypothetical protein
VIVRSWPLLNSIIFCGVQRQRRQLSPFVADLRFAFDSAYQDIGIVRHCGRDTQVWEQRLGWHGNLRARDLVRRGFVTGTGYKLFDDDELGLGPGGGTQMFQYGEAIFVSPVVEYFADKEDGDVLLLRWLWFKEVVTLVDQTSVGGSGAVQVQVDEPWSFTRPDSCASGMFFFQNCNFAYCQIIRDKLYRT